MLVAMSWLYPSIAGLLAAPCGGVLGILVTYAILALRAVSEREGRRGLAAFAYGAIPGVILGFLLAFRFASWLSQGGGGEWRRVLAGVSIALPLAIIAGAVGLVVGTHWAEARGVLHEGGARARWARRFVALPAVALGAAAGYALGVWLGTAA
jgi:hypothetical protein